MSDGHVPNKLGEGADGRLDQEIDFAASDGVAKLATKLQSTIQDNISGLSIKGSNRPLGSIPHLLQKLEGAASRVLGKQVATSDVIIFVEKQLASERVTFDYKLKGSKIMPYDIQSRLVVRPRWPPGLAGTRLTVGSVREDLALIERVSTGTVLHICTHQKRAAPPSTALRRCRTLPIKHAPSRCVCGLLDTQVSKGVR